MDPSHIPSNVQQGGLPASAEQAAEQEQRKRAVEEQREVMLGAVMSTEARDRLHRVSLVKPEKARAVEDLVLMRAKRGQLAEKVTEDQLIQLLKAAQGGASGAGASSASTTAVTFRRRDLDDDDQW